MKAKRLISSMLAFSLVSSFATISFANEETSIDYLSMFGEEDLDIDYGNNNSFVEDFNGAEEMIQSRSAQVTINVKTYKFKYNGKECVVKGDGTDEGNIIQAMFDSIQSKYKNKSVTVYFPAGHYKSSKKITIYSNMTIKGDGTKTKLTNTKRNPFFVNGVSSQHYNYKNLKKDYKGNAGSNITIRDVQFYKSRAISISHGKNILIENIHVFECPNNHAIEIGACKYVTVNKSTFEGMNVKDTSEGMKERDFNEFIQIDANLLAGFPHFGVYNSGTYQAVASDITIKNSTFKKSSNWAYPTAIGTHGSFKNVNPGFKNIVIENCTIDGSTNSAIRFQAVEDLTIKNNKFSNTPTAFEYSNQSKYMTTKEITLSNNVFNKVAYGINIEKYTSNAKINTINISNNKFTGSNKNTSTGIRIAGTSKISKINSSNNTFANFKNNTVNIEKTSPAPVAKQYNVKVLKDTKIYEDRNTNVKVLHSVKKGDTLKIEDTSFATWKKVITENKKGFILTSDVQNVTSSSTSNNQNSSSSNQNTSTTTGVIDTGGSNLNLRSGPGTNYNVITSLKNGTKVTILGKSGTWSKISANGKTGYVSSQWIKTSSSSNSTSNQNTSTTTGVIDTGGSNLNLRSGPGTNYNVITSLKNGTKVTILGKSGTWSKISANGKTGYVLSQWINTRSSSNSTSNQNTSTKKGIISTGGSNLNLRSGPGTNYNVIASLKNGMNVTILGKSGTWTKVSANGKIGYVSSQYVK